MDAISELRLFILVLSSGSFSAAGRQLGLSPASVSRQINRLEDSLGTRLINRSSRRISLTEAGELFRERVFAILRDIDETRMAVTELGKSPQGMLHVHSTYLIGQYLILPMVPDFLKQYPGINLQLTFSEEPIDLVEKNVDVSIRREATNLGLSLMIRKLGSCSRVLCASPGYLKTRGEPRSPEELGGHLCLTYRFDLGDHTWRFKSASGIKKVAPASIVQSNSGEALRRLALSDQGIALLPRWCVEADLKAGWLVAIMKGYEFAPTNVSFLYSIYAVYQRARHQAPKVRAFLNVLGGAIRQQERMH